MPDAFLPELLQPLVQALVQGTLLGGYYAIMAVGLSLMVGVVRFINLAHGDMAVLGALLVITLTQGLGRVGRRAAKQHVRPLGIEHALAWR